MLINLIFISFNVNFRLNVTVEIDTSTVQGFLFSAHVNLIWPRLIRKCGRIVEFPLTQIGNLSVSLFFKPHEVFKILHI